jgi:hypothetical protein
MNMTVVTASPQKYPGSDFTFIMHRAMLTMLWLHCSTTPFCCGEYGAVSWRTMPRSVQYLQLSSSLNLESCLELVDHSGGLVLA